MTTGPAFRGGCLCGTVRYAISRPLFNVDTCHCSMCRRQHGAVFSTYADFWRPGTGSARSWNACPKAAS